MTITGMLGELTTEETEEQGIIELIETKTDTTEKTVEPGIIEPNTQE